MKSLFVLLITSFIATASAHALTCENNGNVEFQINVTPMFGSNHSIWTFQGNLFEYFKQNNLIASDIQSSGPMTVGGNSASVDAGSSPVVQTFASFDVVTTSESGTPSMVRFFSLSLVKDPNSSGYLLVETSSSTQTIPGGNYRFQSCSGF